MLFDAEAVVFQNLLDLVWNVDHYSVFQCCGILALRGLHVFFLFRGFLIETASGAGVSILGTGAV